MRSARSPHMVLMFWFRLSYPSRALANSWQLWPFTLSDTRGPNLIESVIETDTSHPFMVLMIVGRPRSPGPAVARAAVVSRAVARQAVIGLLHHFNETVQRIDRKLQSFLLGLVEGREHPAQILGQTLAAAGIAILLAPFLEHRAELVHDRQKTVNDIERRILPHVGRLDRRRPAL